MENVSVSVSPAANVTATEGMNVLVIDDQWTLGAGVAAELRRDGHEVHVRSDFDTLCEEMEALDPQVVVLHLRTGRRGAGEALTLIRRRFAHVHVIVYTSSTVDNVRAQLKPDLVLHGDSPSVFASQFRCWTRYV
jgi:DNA-binding NtrC family response regulator